MKLKNKQENKIEELEGVYIADEKIFMTTIDEDGHRNLQSFDSLEELQKTFEDYEEPKKYYYICHDGEVRSDADALYTKDCKLIGNYFETKVEADKALEKLKALTRLKDKGLRIKLRHFGHNATLEANYDVLEGDYRDLATVFGDE